MDGAEFMNDLEAWVEMKVLSLDFDFKKSDNPKKTEYLAQMNKRKSNLIKHIDET